jgi:hypothetical protein
MSEAGWAERKARKAAHSIQPVDFGSCEGIRVFAKRLEDEHRRAVRVVEQEIEAVKNDQRTYRSEERCLILGSLETVLKALQRGRE